MARFFPDGRIGQMHGQAKKMEGRVVMAMYHPAAALHQPSLRRAVEEDFARLPEILKHAEKLPAAEEPPENPQQLSLF
jgi:DNA polymerase